MTRMTLATFTFLHVLISLVGIASGLIAMTKLLRSRPVAVLSLYGKHLSGIWRPIYVVRAMMSLYLNVFVLIVHSAGLLQSVGRATGDIG